MTVFVELYGIPRQRAGIDRAALELAPQSATLGAAITLLAERWPGLAECCRGSSLRAGYSANLNGQRFVSDPATPLAANDVLLVLSADAGG